MYPYADVDLLHSPGFDRSELSDLRELLWRAQKMARIGNWVTTWRREFEEGDLGSGVVPWAIREGIASEEEFAALATGRGDPESLAAALRENDVRAAFLDRWWELRREVERDVEMESFDVETFLEGMEGVAVYHLATAGVK